MPASQYWELRKELKYYRVAARLAKQFAPNAKSAIDVGAANTQFLDLLDWIPQKTALDRNFKPQARTAEPVRADFMRFRPRQYYDLVFCLQVLEHLRRPERFAQKLLHTGAIVIISVPYNWKKGLCNGHIQDPVDDAKLLRWVNKPWIEKRNVTDAGARRSIAVFEGINKRAS